MYFLRNSYPGGGGALRSLSVPIQERHWRTDPSLKISLCDSILMAASPTKEFRSSFGGRCSRMKVSKNLEHPIGLVPSSCSRSLSGPTATSQQTAKLRTSRVGGVVVRSSRRAMPLSDEKISSNASQGLGPSSSSSRRWLAACLRKSPSKGVSFKAAAKMSASSGMSAPGSSMSSRLSSTRIWKSAGGSRSDMHMAAIDLMRWSGSD